MTDPGFRTDHVPERDDAVDLASRVLVWLLLGGILLILLVVVVTVARDLLALLAGATTLIAFVAVAGLVVLALRVVRLEERLRRLEEGHR